MKIAVKCYASLSRLSPADPDAFEAAPGETVGQIMSRLGIPAEEVKLIFVNGVHRDADAALAEGDRLGLFPAVGGG